MWALPGLDRGGHIQLSARISALQRHTVRKAHPSLRRLIAAPEIVGVDLDAAPRVEAHAAVLARKPMVAALFRERHELMAELDRVAFADTAGLRVELGAGAAPVAQTFGDVLATDVVPGPGLDGVLDAQNMALSDASVRALYGQNCFHHLPDPLRFLREAERVLAPGGGVILLEPYHGPAASVVFKRLFASEGFDKRMQEWTSDAQGPMRGANQALSYIVFFRDRDRFEAELPGLELVRTEPLDSYLRYLLSGGLNFRQLAPSFSEPVLRAIERGLRPARRVLALHHVVVLRRRSDPPSWLQAAHGGPRRGCAYLPS